MENEISVGGSSGSEGAVGEDASDDEFLANESSDDDDALFEQFVDEASSGMSCDSESNSDSIDVVGSDKDLDEKRLSDDDGNGSSYPVFNHIEMYDPLLELGMIFSSKKEFKLAVQSHAIKNKRSVKFTKNDSFRVYAVCTGDGCEWIIHANKIKNEQTWQINLYKSEHTCPQVFKVRNVKTSWLSERFLQDFKSDPKRNVKGWRVDIMNQLRCHVSRDQAYRAKKKALKKLEGSPEHQFTKLWDYAEELRSTNPGSTVILGINDETGENRFEKFYVCFSALKQGWLRGCRPIIGVDGCHLKGPHGGVLLTAVGVDPNNNLYPIAYVVVQRENGDTWEWFLTVLKQDLKISRDEEYTFMSDKQKGLIQAFHVVFPNSEHRFCVRHLHNNFKNAGYRGLAFKNALWKAARSSTVGEFKLKMEEMRLLDQGAFDWFNDKPPQEWSKSHFTEHPKCDMLLNNVCESFNANILNARDKPILTMLEWIREYLMKRLQENRDRAAKKWKGTICPKIKKLVQKHADKIGDCIPIKANDRHYQISCYDGSQFSVDLEKRTCTCRIWQLTGIPCKHACSAIFNQNLMPEDMVHPYYNVDTYKQVYEPAILPISGEMLWSETLFIPPMPPNFGRGPGRPAGARNREPDEQAVKNKKKRGKKQGKPFKLKRQKTNHHCTICGEAGYNAKGTDRTVIYKQNQKEETLHLSRSMQSSTTKHFTSSYSTRKPNQEDDLLTQENLTIPGLSMTQQSVRGPSMYEQLHMGNPNISVQPQVILHPRLNIRAPPPMTGSGIMPSFSSRPAVPLPKTIIKEHGQKYVNLSSWPSNQNKESYGKN
ncbi:UNVERIFIED_CONTAM: hypothetical protein Sradi_2155200 [Sesamum radiatum]|uniref:SWIM-type domain-containing protein n=1 Tax=Sesamum radiatum TaxID=300843 RepID=A0AAW2T104_SESRA